MNSPEETQVVVTDIQMPFVLDGFFHGQVGAGGDTDIPDTGRLISPCSFSFFSMMDVNIRGQA